MKKLFILSLMLIALPALAATICADDDVIAIVLDPNVAGIRYTHNANAFEWGTTFPYGTIWGISTCVDKGGTENSAVNELRSEDGELVTGGERKGQYCWCQMTHPVVSKWVLRTNNSTIDYCLSNCTRQCADRISSSTGTELRGAIFGSTPH